MAKTCENCENRLSARSAKIEKKLENTKMKVNTKKEKSAINNSLGYRGDLYSYLTPESGFKYVAVISKDRWELCDGLKGQVIGNVWLGDEAGIRIEIHGDDGFVHYVNDLNGARKIA